MNRKRVLFVDDEQSILDGLRDLLRKERRQWNMVFASGGQEALDELERAPFDVIVSDMRMPGMDGATLLAKVKESYPGVARIVLSGHAERDAVIRALPVAHQFLSKPCDAALLRTVIERTCTLQSLLRDPALRRVVGKLDRLPSLPRTYERLRDVVARSDVAVAEIAAVVAEDPGMTAKILQLVNSAYFGSAQRITSIAQAVSYLGIELIKGLALTAHVFTATGPPPIEGFSLERLQEYSLLIARLAKRFVGNPRRGDEAFTAGLLHDVGKIVLALGLPARFAEAVREARSSGRCLAAVERERIGVSHAHVGAYLLGVWGLPFTIVEAVAYHHEPSVVTSGDREVLAAVHAADALVEMEFDRSVARSPCAEIDRHFLDTGGFAAQLPQWRAIAAEQIAASKAPRS